MGRFGMVGAQGVPHSADINELHGRCGPNGPIDLYRAFHSAPAPRNRTGPPPEISRGPGAGNDGASEADRLGGAINETESKPQSEEAQGDPRFAFLCVAHSHYSLIDAGDEPIDIGFAATVRAFDKFFPPCEPACPTCGLVPCANPSFCAVCVRADRQHSRRLTAPTIHPTPQTVVEAIVCCVRGRGLKALREPKVKAWIDDCDTAAKQQLKSRIKQLPKVDTNELRRTA